MAVPTAATTQRVAAVVSPTTDERSFSNRIVPAPRKPIPVTICAAMRVRSDGRADRGNDPESRGRRESDDRRAVFLEQDRAGAQETDTGDDLRGDAGPI